MSDEAGGASTIKDYLLGDLPESEAEKIERWYFADRQAVDEIWAVFGEMAEEYLSGALSESESRRFEQMLRPMPALREMFENEKALFNYAARVAAEPSRQAPTGDSIADAERKRRWPRAAFFKPQLVVASAIALIGAGAWFALRTREDAKPVSPAQAQKGSQQTMAPGQESPDRIARPSVDLQQSPRPGRDVNDELAEREKSSNAAGPGRRKSTSTISPGITATFLLSAARLREGQSDPVLEIPAKTDTVQLELELSNDDCVLFSAVLHAESNEALQRWEKLRARRDHSTPRVVLRARADSLKNASYVIRLDCVSSVVPAEQYRFKVEKK